MPTTQESLDDVRRSAASTPRVDGPLKVSGTAQYTSDFHFPGLLYAVPVEATIANGRVVKLDTAAAEKMPGVRAIFHRGNIGKIFRSVPGPGFEGICRRAPAAVRGRRGPLLRPVRRAGRGRHVRGRQGRRRRGSRHLRQRRSRTSIPTSRPTTSRTCRPRSARNRVQSERGDADAAFATAPVKLDQTYVTPAETHNPIELHATTAIWDGSTADALRIVAGRRQPPGRAGADVRPAAGERPRHHQVPRLGFRRQAVAVDALPARRRGGAAARQAGQARRQPQDDVPDGRPSPAHRSSACGSAPRPTASSSRSSTTTSTTRRSSTTTTKTAARRRRSSTACPTCA